MKIYNPSDREQPGSIRDPAIRRIGDRYYMVGTSPNYWEGYTPGVKMWSSTDLAHWNPEGLMISADAVPEDAWCKNRFWAPELFAYKGRFYITVSGRNEEKGTPFGLFIASSDCVTGPYVLKEDGYVPLIIDGIDAHLFADEDGSVWLFYSSGNIFAVRFDMETLCPIGEPRRILNKGEAGQWDGIGIEGPSVVKRNGLYYLWYSSWTRGYEMGWATAETLDGEFTKWPQNPVLSGLGSAIPCVGHNCTFVLQDGRDAVAFHGHVPGGVERLCIDAVDYPMASRPASECIEV